MSAVTSTSTPRLPRVRASELVGRGWLNTGGKDVTLADLRGKVVVLDFWTFCCINCLHVLDELREIEARHRDVLVIIGVHSPKFVHEADPVALAAAVERYEVHHPVLDDPELVTWQAFTARAWPTLVVIDPEGYVVAQMAGEGHAHAVESLVGELVAEHEAKGTLHRGDGPYVAPQPQPTTLRFPADALELPGGTFLVADAGHHALTEVAADGETLVRRIGSGDRGLVDGGPGDARLSEPNGLCLVPDELRETLGYDVLVADTVNHALRGVRLADGHVTTVAGTGEQYMVGAVDNVVGGATETGVGDRWDARQVKLSSPWDVAWSPELAAFVVAMAGHHTLWAFDAVQGTITHLAGTMNEGLVDGAPADAWFAQPSRLSRAADGRLWLADAETSALRWFDPADGGTRTAVGTGLFDFGHRDGPAGQALFQHPLGVAALPDGSVLVADTYNGALRRWVPGEDGGAVSTLATDLAEPSALVLPAGDPDHVVVVESAAHRLTRVPLPAGAGTQVDGGAHRTQRPVTELGTDVALEVVFHPAAGQKLDDRWGPSTSLQVAATPPGLLLDGTGGDVALTRTLRLDPAVGEGVLHVTARAASCDADPAIEHPACHLAAQDWGVPVRVVDGAAAALVLPLHG
ncbi:NHL domain-containing thioredoxin family protein [Cellulomonas wangsupingiae]|uniref:NHL domain-containing thioredoxin family protein n=1 Tax=Cellulomonas wangsupingiae TaxID=2968085 RepID=UPI001D0F1354|nr:NHL domain-containing thioredoxin family protein [Cellulomonas wangsupingiae]MCM0641051.1 NHL domain-containing thioredoxin family protein [Cellulomonas wangsupingiae]